MFLWDVHQTTFHSWGGGNWAYYENSPTRNHKGHFGDMHFVKSRVRVDVFDHEKMHLVGDILRSKNRVWTVYNEEWIAVLSDGLTRRFWREYKKLV